MKFLPIQLLALMCMVMTTMSAQTTQTINVLEEVGVSWGFDSAAGWSFVDSSSTFTDSADITFVTVQDSVTVMRVQADSGLAGAMAALISSNNIDTLLAGDYHIEFRFRNGTGGMSSTPGALEYRAYIQDYATFTNSTLQTVSNDSARQIIAAFKGGGIFSAGWAMPTLTDTDVDNNWADSLEWVVVTIDFSLTDTLYDQAFKLLVRIGPDHTAIEDVNFEFDYLEWTTEVPLDTMPNDTMPADTAMVFLDSTVFGSRGIDWEMDSMRGWALVPGPSLNAVPTDLTFNTVEDSVTVMRMTAPMGLAGDMAAVVSSDQMDTIPSGEYHMLVRFRNGTGGSEANPGPLEIRTFLQDHATWTNFSPDPLAAGQVFGLFKLGGISPSWPNATIMDSDTTDDFADTGEWVDVELDFDIEDTLYDVGFKILFRIGTAHTATEDVNFEIDYIQWNEGPLPVDTTNIDTMTSINQYVAQNSIRLFPNPTSETANLTFNLTYPASVSMKIYSVSGQQVKAIDPRTFTPGQNQLEIGVSDLNEGLYIYKLMVNDATYTGKLSIVK